MLWLKKKQVILVILVVLLIAAVYTNYAFFNPAKEAAETDNPLNAELVANMDEEASMGGNAEISDTFFTDYRLEREKTRGENIETLEGIVQSEGASVETIDNANEEMIALVQLSEQELLLENLIKSKGFEDCIVFIHQGYVNVLVDAVEITQQQAVQIQDAVASECGVELSKITIAVSGK